MHAVILTLNYYLTDTVGPGSTEEDITVFIAARHTLVRDAGRTRLGTNSASRWKYFPQAMTYWEDDSSEIGKTLLNLSD